MDVDKMNANNDAIVMLREAQSLLDEAAELIRDAVRGTSVDGDENNWLLLAARANIDRLVKRLARENSEEAGKP